jgi:hypothetical protein
LWDVFAVIGAFFCGMVLIATLGMVVNESTDAKASRAERIAQAASERVAAIEQQVNEQQLQIDELYTIEQQ